MLSKGLRSPFLFALLVGLYPPLFYVSNNWFMFKPSLSLFIIGLVTITTFLLLSTFYLTVSFGARKTVPASSEIISKGLLVFAGTFAGAFLLRQTILELVSNNTLVFLGIVLIPGALLAWFIQRIQFSRLNAVLIVLCVVNVATIAMSMIATDATELHEILEPALDLEQTDQLLFPTKRNVYYIVPDAYPNREALARVYGIDNEEFYRQLETWGFTLTHPAYSNYVSTLSSVPSLFGMGHHYYRQYVGNEDFLGARALIAGSHNPSMSVFRNNGYRIHLIHQTDYLLTTGCFADTCSPGVFGEEAFNMLLPYRIKARFGLLEDQSIEGFEERIFQHLEMTVKVPEPQFTYVHFLRPGHSAWNRQSKEELQVFRREFISETQSANALMGRMIQFILREDPNALIILNADHGGFGLGWMGPAEEELFEDVPKDLTALDHIGVLLAVRWPDGLPAHQPEIQSNVNLFRHVFAFLSGNDAILETPAPNDGYLRTTAESVVKVMHDGKLLVTFEEIPSQSLRR